MAIEVDDLDHRQMWAEAARAWYLARCDKEPNVGRLYHHLAIVSTSDAVEKIYLFFKSLCVPVPFPTARSSITTNVFARVPFQEYSNMTWVDYSFVKVHRTFFNKHGPAARGRPAQQEFLGDLTHHIFQSGPRWLVIGHQVAITNCCALLGYGDTGSALMRALRPQQQQEEEEPDMDMLKARPEPWADWADRVEFVTQTHKTVFSLFQDPQTYSYVHVSLAFLHHLSKNAQAVSMVAKQHPWALTAKLLNSISLNVSTRARIETRQFPGPETMDEPWRPLPEDYALRGLLFTQDYFPPDWFSGSTVDEAERHIEGPSVRAAREERILWLGWQMAQAGDWLTYDARCRRFAIFRDPSPWDDEDQAGEDQTDEDQADDGNQADDGDEADSGIEQWEDCRSYTSEIGIGTA